MHYNCPGDLHFSISDFLCLKPSDAGCEPSRKCMHICLVVEMGVLFQLPTDVSLF